MKNSVTREIHGSQGVPKCPNKSVPDHLEILFTQFFHFHVSRSFSCPAGFYLTIKRDLNNLN